MNYIASIVYGALALVLLYGYSYSVGNDGAMVLVVIAAALAWASCYMGTAYDMGDGRDVFLRITSIVLTLVAVLVYLVAFARLFIDR